MPPVLRRGQPGAIRTSSGPRIFSDIEKLAEVQLAMLNRALEMVRPGGLVIFSNCSLDPLEGEDMITRLLENGASAERTAFPAGKPEALAHLFDAEGAIRTTPADTLDGEIGLDGFYAVALRRI